MAKQTPFFKFDSLSWLGGSIQFTDLASKGLFIDLCALYWESQKPVKIDTKFKVRIRCDEGTLNELLGTLSDLDIIVQSEHGITVPFLDSLMSDRNDWLDKCSKAGKKSATNKGTSSNKKEESRKKKEENRNNTKEEPLTVSISIDPTTPTRPKPDAWSKFCETYPKPFNPMCSFTRSAFHEAVSIADGDDVILAATSMYSNYFTKTNEPLQYASSAQKWLEAQSWRTDWNAEAVKKKSSGKKGMSNSKPSAIKAGDVF